MGRTISRGLTQPLSPTDSPSMMPSERKSWWCWLAKEEKRQPRAATRPPMTAVRRVDLRRHTATVTGDASSDTHVHSEHSHTEKQILLVWIYP